MAKNLFSVPIFFILFRETLEASIIVSVLLGLVEQIVKEDPGRLVSLHTLVSSRSSVSDSEKDGTADEKTDVVTSPRPRSAGEVSQDEGAITEEPVLKERDTSLESTRVNERVLMRKLRIQIFAGSAIGFTIAASIGAAFITVWFTKASDLWSKSEELWEGIFELIASLMIAVMGISMLKLDRAKAKWRVKLQKSFAGMNVDAKTRTGKWVLFILPLITVMREGIEAVIFAGGVSLGQPAISIPIAAIVGVFCGITCGFLIYEFASRAALRIFLIVMTNFLLIIGAGLFSQATWAFQENTFNNLLGADVDDTGGDGPGSYDVRGNVWHLDCCNPENNQSGAGWLIFGAIFGWTNSASVGSVLSYVFYWLAVMAVLVYLKFKEGRTKLFGHESELAKRRNAWREQKEALPQ